MRRRRQWAEATPGERFLDCGAGHGRAVAAFALGFGGSSLGVEIRPHLVETARQCLAKLEPQPLPGVVVGDIFAPELDYGGYDIVFLNTTGFDESLMRRCSQVKMINFALKY